MTPNLQISVGINTDQVLGDYIPLQLTLRNSIGLFFTKLRKLVQLYYIYAVTETALLSSAVAAV